MKRTIKACGGGAILQLAILALAGGVLPTSADAADSLRFRLEYVAEGYHAHFFLALERGFYADEGIDLTIAEGQGSVTLLKLISEGQDVIGRADYGTMAKAVAEGFSVKAIFGEMQASPICIVSPADAPLAAPADLVGKLLAMAPAESSAQLFPPLLAANNVDPKTVNIVNPAIGAKNVLLLQRRVDAIAGYSNIHPVQLRAAGLDTVYFQYADHGIQTLSNGIIANTDFLDENPDLVRRFLRATRKGYDETMKDPEAAVDALLKHYPLRATEREVYIGMLKNTFPLLHTPNNQGQPIGWMADADWAETQRILLETGAITQEQPLDRYYTNAFVPD
jgi:NitT/TauT family transport system substrate-binding protein